MDESFGSDEVLLDRVTDAAGALSHGDMERVTSVLNVFQQRFPQLFVAVYCGALPPQTSLRQFGFWLLNRAAICDLEATRPNENGALLVIDTHGRSAALVPGYFLECYIHGQDAVKVLQAAQRDFQRNLWAAGICAAVAELTVRLRRKAAEAAKFPDRFIPPRPPASPAPPQFVRMRHGHTHAPEPSETP